MKKILGAITKTGASALALAMGLSVGTAYAGIDPDPDPVPGEHGGSAGFVDFSVLSSNEFPEFVGAVTSILGGEIPVSGIVTTDSRNGFRTQADFDVVPLANGTVTGSVTLRVFDDNQLVLVREVPVTAGGHRFRETWRRDYRNAPSSIDGDLTRVIGHALAIRAVQNGSGAVIRAITDPDERIVNSRFDIAPWIGIARTKVVDLNNEANPDIPGRVAQGSSDLVFFGPMDAAQHWEINDETITRVNNNTVHAETDYFNPYFFNDRRTVASQDGDALIKVLPYDTNRNLPGKYAVLYRNFDASTGRAGLFQTGWLVATGSEINGAIANDSLSRLLFGNDEADVDGTVFDTRFICVSPAARTVIDSARNPSHLVRPDAPSN